MHGDKEQICLNFVKSNIKCENYYGLSEEDIAEFTKCLNSSTPNENSSEFPDFICDNGFIEHFQVTSSVDNKKGSKQIKEEFQFKNTVSSEVEEFQKNYMPNSNTFYHNRFQHPIHSHNYFVQSFKKHWEHHIKSLNNYKISKQVGIFLVEYKDSKLYMLEQIKDNSIPPSRRQKQFDYYDITKDKEVLNYIYNFKNEVQFVIMVCGEHIMVVKVSSIPQIINKMDCEYQIVGGEYTVTAFTSIPISFTRFFDE